MKTRLTISSDVSNNAITSLPDGFATLKNLTHFDASANNVTGTIPPSLVSSPSIVTINLASNQLSGDVTINAPALSSLSLEQNRLNSISVQNTASLSEVYLESNGFTGDLPDLSSATGLSSFNASYNKSVPTLQAVVKS